MATEPKNGNRAGAKANAEKEALKKRQDALAAKRKAEKEAEEKRLAGLRAAADDGDKDTDDERDEDPDDQRDGEDKDGEDKDADDERDGDEADTDEDGEDDGDKRAAPSKADVRKAADEAVKRERERSATITELADKAGVPKLGARHLAKGTSVRAFRDLLLTRMLEKQGADGNAALGSTGERSLDPGARRAPRGPNAEQREMSEGTAHWRSVSGKPAPAATA